MADRVNVILHGIFGYVFTPKCIDAYTPAVCGHIYAISRSRQVWIPQRIKELPNSDVVLSGLQSGWSFVPNPKESPVVPLEADAAIDEFKKRRCKISLPYPTIPDAQSKRYWAMDESHVGSIFGGRDAAGLNQIQPFPSMHVFSYERDGSPLQFELPRGENMTVDDLEADHDTPLGFTNLHIWCTTPPMDMDLHGRTKDGHLRRGFAALVDMFPTLEVTIQFPDGFTPAAPKSEALPQGMQRCDVDPGRESCRSPEIGHVNCHYANIMAVQV